MIFQCFYAYFICQYHYRDIKGIKLFLLQWNIRHLTNRIITMETINKIDRALRKDENGALRIALAWDRRYIHAVGRRNCRLMPNKDSRLRYFYRRHSSSMVR